MSSSLSVLEEENDQEQRLEAVQKAIRKATKEALSMAQNEQPREFKYEEENNDPNVSFALAASLFEETDKVEHDFRVKLDLAEAELKDLMTQQEQPPDIAVNNDPAELEAEAEELTRQIAFLRECSNARLCLDEATSRSDWLESAQLLAKAQAALASADDMFHKAEGELSPAPARLETAFSILESIRIPLRRKRVELLGRAETAIRTSVELSSNSIRVKSSADAFDVIQELGAPLDAVRSIADNINRQVFQPLLQTHRNEKFSGSWVFRENTESTGIVSKGSVHVLEWKSRGNEDTASDDSMQEKQINEWGETLKLIQKVMSFVQERALLRREALCETFGKRLFGTSSSPDSLNLEAFGLESNLIGGDSGLVMRPMIRLMWDTCIPSCRWTPEQLARLPNMAEKLHRSCQAFEDDMIERHFFAADDSKLSEFCTNFEAKYAETRRAQVLGEARDLLLNQDYHNTVSVGVDITPGPNDDVLGEDDGMSIFKLHKCSVSVTSSKLYGMCLGAMDEAVESPDKILAPTLYRTARELLDLFRAIIPAAHGSDVANSPRTVAVFHNDCVFLAHQCLTLGLEYKEKFQGEDLRQACIFVDMVPPFRELADRSMGDMIEKQKMQLLDIVGSRITILGDALASNESLSEWTDAETALNAAVNHLRHLSQAWKPILSDEVYTGSIGHLVDVTFTLYLDRVMEAKAISEPASHFVGALFRNATRNMSKLVSKTRLWDRFTAIGRFMDMSLINIQSALSEGVFRSVTGPELSRLIVATFDDSEKRRRLLQALASDQEQQ